MLGGVNSRTCSAIINDEESKGNYGTINAGNVSNNIFKSGSQSIGHGLFASGQRAEAGDCVPDEDIA